MTSHSVEPHLPLALLLQVLMHCPVHPIHSCSSSITLQGRERVLSWGVVRNSTFWKSSDTKQEHSVLTDLGSTAGV